MQTHAYSKCPHTPSKRGRVRERDRGGRLAPRLEQAGSVAHAWQTEMMIVGEASSLLASVSARCPRTRYGKCQAGVGGGLSEPREDTGCGRWRQRLQKDEQAYRMLLDPAEQLLYGLLKHYFKIILQKDLIRHIYHIYYKYISTFNQWFCLIWWKTKHLVLVKWSLTNQLVTVVSTIQKTLKTISSV